MDRSSDICTRSVTHCTANSICFFDFWNKEIGGILIGLSVDDIMVVCAVRPLVCSHITPLSIFRTRQGLTNFIASKQQSIISIMEPKISEGQDEKGVIAETKVLRENGWRLDDEEMGIKKTYHFETYTKALVIGIS